jgi:ADP-ribose pyrophosphatase YjhB (NUDIX family)
MPVKVSCSAIIERPTYSSGERGIILVSELNKRGEVRHMNLPGGGPKKGEPLDECMQREVLEETGLEVQPTAIIGFYDNLRTRAGNHLLRIVYGTQIIGGLMQQSDKHPIVRAYSLEEIKLLDGVNRLQKNAAMVAIEDYFANVSYSVDIIKRLPRL